MCVTDYSYSGSAVTSHQLYDDVTNEPEHEHSVTKLLTSMIEINHSRNNVKAMLLDQNVIESSVYCDSESDVSDSDQYLSCTV